MPERIVASRPLLVDTATDRVLGFTDQASPGRVPQYVPSYTVNERGVVSWLSGPDLAGGVVSPLSGNGLLDPSTLNWIESGLLPPASGTIAAATLAAGVAYIAGNRVALPATPLALAATRDNYIDLRNDGLVIVTPVTVGAAAPAIPANSMRLGFSTTNASNVTARSIQAFDSLGNWMHNTVSVPACRVIRSSTSVAYGGAAVAIPFSEPDAFDNANIHDPSVNNTRFLLPSSGAYQVDCSLIWFSAVTPTVAFTLAPRLTDPTLGVISDSSFDEGYQGAQATQSMRCSGVITGLANQYIEMIFNPNGASGSIGVARFSMTKLST